MINLKVQLLHAVGGLRVARPQAYKNVKNIRLGAPVYIESQLIGRVIDIIGPVSRPYIVIKPVRPIRVDDIYGIEAEVRGR